MAGMISMHTHLKGVLDFRDVFDLDFYLLWRSDIICRMCQSLPWSQFLSKHLQYLCTVVTLLIYVLISDATITQKIYFLEFAFVILTFPSFLPKMHVLFVHYAVRSPHSIRYHWRKTCKNLYEKFRYVPKSST